MVSMSNHAQPLNAALRRAAARHARKTLLLSGLLALLLGSCGSPAEEGFTPSGRWRYAAGRDTRGGTVRRISVEAEHAIAQPARRGQSATENLTPVLLLECYSGHWQASMRVGNVAALGMRPGSKPVDVTYRGDHDIGSSRWYPGEGVAGLETSKVDFLPALRASRRFSFHFDTADAIVREIRFDVSGAAETIEAFEQRCNRPPGLVSRLFEWLIGGN